MSARTKAMDGAGHLELFQSPSSRDLHRQRLLALDKGQPILVAEAPSGYGKTVLARSWLGQAPEGVRRAWVTLDESTRDPAVLLERVAMSLFGPLPEEREAVPDDEANRAERFAQIAELLSDEQQPVWLVFDDAHMLADSSARNYLRRLLLGSGPHLRIFIAMQPVAMDVGLGNLTAQNRVCWINAGSLALTRDEVGEVARLREHHADAQQLDWLVRATQGWPALVQLALAVPRDRGQHFPSSIGRLGPVREYIYERFLSRLEPAERDVLWILACVGDAPLALLRALAPAQPDAESSLQRLFTIGIVQQGEPLHGPQVHIHPLVCEAVLRVLSPERAQGKPQLQLAAANWYWRHGLGTAAVRLLLEAGRDHLPTARDWLFELSSALVFKHGQHQTVLDLVEQWEFAADRCDALLDRMATWALIFQRRFAEAQLRLERALGALRDVESEDEGQLQRAVILALSDDYESAGKLSLDWLERHKHKSSFLSSIAWTVYGFQLKCIGDADLAMTLLLEAHRGFNQAQSGFGTAWAHVVGALALVKVGSYRDALAEVERGIARCGNASGLGGQRAMLRGVEAFIRYERNELASVREILNEGLPLLPEQSAVDVIVLGFTAAARMRAAAGDVGAALDLLSEGESCGKERDFPRLSLSLLAERALVLARSGATGQARQVAESAGLRPDAQPRSGLRWDRAGRLYARLALADGDAETAQQLLAPLLARTRVSKQRYKLCELLILKSLADEQKRNDSAAFDALTEALGLAAAENYVRVFLDEGAELGSLLRRWLKAHAAAPRLRSEAGWAEALLKEMDAGQDQAQASRDLPLQPLNKRERQILSLLDQGLSNAEIAARCFLVEGTVKWNLHNLYGKLGVKSRTAALRAAREHGILQS